MSSIQYYDNNAQDFYNRTIDADVSDLYQEFLKYVPKEGCILDAGCGSGRDSKYFLNNGYAVLPFDGSIEMVKLTSKLIGQDALQLLFEEMRFSSEFHAVWANASLIHVPYENLRSVIERFHQALLPSGILYASFKYGTSMRPNGDRIFYDMNEMSIEPYLKGLFKPLKIWKSVDVRSTVAPSPDKSWLNIIAKAVKTVV